jgi:hypothetical protein
MADFAREPYSASAGELTLRCHGHSNDRLKIGADNFLHAVDLRKS